MQIAEHKLARAAKPASCCSDFYEQDWVRQIAGDNFHPGGEALTRRTVEAMELPAGSHVLDLGCGTGTTAMLLARDWSYRVSGVDPSVSNLTRAQSRLERARSVSAARQPQALALQYVPGRASALPFRDASVDGVLSECSFSLFADKPRALAEIRRVLRPGGRLGLTDMAINGSLPQDIQDVIAPWTCLEDALDRSHLLQLFLRAGFVINSEGDESRGLRSMIATLKRNLLVLGAGAIAGGIALPPIDVEALRYWLDRLAGEVNSGVITYLRFNLYCP